MPEQIFQSVWCQVFAATCVRLHAEDQDLAIETAATEADWAAANAVEKWNVGKQAEAVSKAERATVRITVNPTLAP